MNKCGHDSGFTYAGCLKCDFDRLQAKLDAVEKKADAILNRREWVVDEDELAEQIIEIIREQK